MTKDNRVAIAQTALTPISASFAAFRIWGGRPWIWVLPSMKKIEESQFDHEVQCFCRCSLLMLAVLRMIRVKLGDHLDWDGWAVMSSSQIKKYTKICESLLAQGAAQPRFNLSRRAQFLRIHTETQRLGHPILPMVSSDTVIIILLQCIDSKFYWLRRCLKVFLLNWPRRAFAQIFMREMEK